MTEIPVRISVNRKEKIYTGRNELMKIFKGIMNCISAVEKFVMGFVMLASTIIIFVNVIVRKFTTTQFAWSEELVVNFFVLMIMCGCALCAQDGSLISLSLIYDLVNQKIRNVMTVIICACNIAFYVLVIMTGFEKVGTQMANGKLTMTLMWPEWVFTIFLPIGACLMLLHTIGFLVDYFIKVKHPEIEGGNEA